MPTGYAAYPVDTDLKAFLAPTASALGITLPTTIDYQQRIDSARQKIEGAIGRTLLATAQTRRFDPPTNIRNVVNLNADLVSVSSLTVQGAALVSGTDYLLGPDNADLDGKPFRWLEIISRTPWPAPLAPTARRSLVIVGIWGYGLLIPTQGYEAMLAQGAIDCYPEISLMVSKGLQMRKEGDVEAMYARGKGNGPLVEEMGAWQLRVSDAINNLMLVEVGL